MHFMSYSKSRTHEHIRTRTHTVLEDKFKEAFEGGPEIFFPIPKKLLNLKLENLNFSDPLALAPAVPMPVSEPHSGMSQSRPVGTELLQSSLELVSTDIIGQPGLPTDLIGPPVRPIGPLVGPALPSSVRISVPRRSGSSLGDAKMPPRERPSTTTASKRAAAAAAAATRSGSRIVLAPSMRPSERASERASEREYVKIDVETKRKHAGDVDTQVVSTSSELAQN